MEPATILLSLLASQLDPQSPSEVFSGRALHHAGLFPATDLHGPRKGCRVHAGEYLESYFTDKRDRIVRLPRHVLLSMQARSLQKMA